VTNKTKQTTCLNGSIIYLRRKKPTLYLNARVDEWNNLSVSMKLNIIVHIRLGVVAAYSLQLWRMNNVVVAS